MADHLTEEEQIETIKRWISENWVSYVLPIVVGLGIYAGWNMWQSHKLAKAQSGGESFAVVLDTIEGSQNKIDIKTAQELEAATASIADEFEKTLYADMSHLLQARVHAENDRLDEAKKALQKVIDSGVNAGVKSVAKVRLAKVHIETGNFDLARSVIAANANESFSVINDEVNGDIAFAENNLQAAHTSYKSALAKLSPMDFQRRAILEYKANATNVVDGVAATEATPRKVEADTAIEPSSEKAAEITKEAEGA